jgi:transcriptional regulator with XRE-family HTH domain
MNILAKRIKAKRAKLKMTHWKLTEKAGLDSNNLSRIECGKSVPTLETLLRISDALNTTPNDLLLDSFDAPTALLDAELLEQTADFSKEERRKLIEYARFLKDTRSLLTR